MLPTTAGGDPAASDPPAVQVFVLGGFRVVVDGRALGDQAWRRKTARQLFKCLLGRPNRRMTRDEVIELLWPESDPDAASSNLRSTIHAMRRALEPAEPVTGRAIVFGDRDSIWLRSDAGLWVDADAFERTLAQAWASSDPLPLLENASALYSGIYLADDLYEEWSIERRERLRQAWAQLQIRLSHELEQRGDAESAARHLQRLVQADPSDEGAAQEVMQLLARHGHRSEALRAYQRLVQALSDELGVTPSEESLAIQRQIASGELAEFPVATTFRCAYPFPEPRDLIGREVELALLERILASGKTAGQAAMVGAPAGTGKSALVGQLVQRAQARGVLCLAGGCYEERGAIPLGPFHDALVDYLLAQPADHIRRELGSSVDDLAQVVPELRYHLKLSESASTSPPTIDRMRAFGAIHAFLRSLAERGPVLVCLEDLHAADEATLQLFHYLARQTRRLPLVIIATYRTDEAPADQPLAQTTAAMARERLAQRISLGALGRAETERLATALLEGSPSQALGESVYTTTGGNPLFVEQLLFALGEAGQLERKAGVWHGTAELQGTPPIVREVIAQRLLLLPASCRDILAMASVLGQSVEHKVLIAALEPIDETLLLRDLDRAIGAHVLQETPAGYAFRHGLLREAVYWELSAPRRMRLHARAGEVLEQVFGPHTGDHVSELAHHFTLAGEAASVRHKALLYSAEAGRRASALSSYPEALAHFSRAWQLLEREGEKADPEMRLEVLRGRGWAEVENAKWADTAATYRKLLAISNDRVVRAQAYGVIAFAVSHAGDLPRVVEECNAGLTELATIAGPEATSARLQLQQMLAMTFHWQGRYNSVIDLGRQMEAEAATVRQPRPLMLANTVIGWGHWGLGQVQQAIDHYRVAVEAAQQLGGKLQIATCYENIGLVDYAGGRFGAAREDLGRAITLFRESASELRAVNSLQTLCRVWVAEGDHLRASEQIVRALELDLHGQERWAADAYYILGVIHGLHAEWEAASTNLERAILMRNGAGHLAGAVEATVELGAVAQYTGRWNDALKSYVAAANIADQMDPSPPRVLARRHLGGLHLLVGEHARAALEIGAAFELARTMPESLEYAPALLAMASLLGEEGRLDEATDLAIRSLDAARPVHQVLAANVVLARLHLASGDFAAAETHAAEAVAHGKTLGSPRMLSVANLVSARVSAVTAPEKATPTFEAALHYADQARTPFERAAALQAYAEHVRAFASHPELADGMQHEAHVILETLKASVLMGIRQGP